MEHDLGSEFTTMKERAMDQIIKNMGISETYNDSLIIQTDSERFSVGAIQQDLRGISFT